MLDERSASVLRNNNRLRRISYICWAFISRSVGHSFLFITSNETLVQ